MFVQWLLYQAPLWMVRRRGWRLAWPGAPPGESSAGELQFGVRQLMIWTAIVAAFLAAATPSDADATSECFAPASGDRYLADLYALARLRLRHSGVEAVYGGAFCTYTDTRRFYSYRRDGETGRMASVVLRC